LEILRSDGFDRYADFLQGYSRELNLGVVWADKGWKNAHHYFNPVTGRGLWNFADAMSVFELYYQTAL
jgi:phospholipase C